MCDDFDAEVQVDELEEAKVWEEFFQLTMDSMTEPSEEDSWDDGLYVLGDDWF